MENEERAWKDAVQKRRRRIKAWLNHIGKAGEIRQELKFMCHKAGLMWATVVHNVGQSFTKCLQGVGEESSALEIFNSGHPIIQMNLSARGTKISIIYWPAHSRFHCNSKLNRLTHLYYVVILLVLGWFFFFIYKGEQGNCSIVQLLRYFLLVALFRLFFPTNIFIC